MPVQVFRLYLADISLFYCTLFLTAFFVLLYCFRKRASLVSDWEEWPGIPKKKIYRTLVMFFLAGAGTLPCAIWLWTHLLHLDYSHRGVVLWLGLFWIGMTIVQVVGCASHFFLWPKETRMLFFGPEGEKGWLRRLFGQFFGL